VQANAEAVPFQAGQFDLIYGKAILHHLDLDLAAAEILRLLKPGGRAVFAEPLAYHPLIWGGRRLTPHFRTRDEHPVTLKELQHFGRGFSACETEVFYLLTPGAYLFRLIPGGQRWFRRVYSWLHRFDQGLWEWWPWLQNLAWYGLIGVRKESRPPHASGG
jgi:SAM-dependent methyltransferase